MKKFLTFILLLCFTTQTFSQAVIILEFYLNRNYIAKNQCENRFRPLLHCNGNCILAKKLKQEQKKDQQLPERKLTGKAEVISSRSFFAGSLPRPFISPVKYMALSDDATVDRSYSIFHPPCC